MTRRSILECTSRLRKQARRYTVVPIVSVDPTLEEGQSMADVAPSIDNETPDRALVGTEMRRLLERKIDRLLHGFRAVFMLRGIEQLSVEETAACQGIPEAFGAHHALPRAEPVARGAGEGTRHSRTRRVLVLLRGGVTGS